MAETESDLKAIKVPSHSPSPEKKKKKNVIRKTSPSSLEDDGSPVRHILCVKNKVDVKQFEEVDDCFILDFDPFEPIQLSKLSVSDHQETPDLAVVAEKGQIACRDYPHSRHLCLKFPFETTPHESYCELCYCYVCDSAAPTCGSWKLDHCHAAEHIGDWKSIRRLSRNQAPAKK